MNNHLCVEPVVFYTVQIGLVTVVIQAAGAAICTNLAGKYMYLYISWSKRAAHKCSGKQHYFLFKATHQKCCFAGCSFLKLPIWPAIFLRGAAAAGIEGEKCIPGGDAGTHSGTKYCADQLQLRLAPLQIQKCETTCALGALWRRLFNF